MCKNIGAYDRDAAIINSILCKPELSTADRMQLISLISVSYHDSGKIEGIFSIDSSAHACSYCEKMRAAAGKNPSIICSACYDYNLECVRPAMLKRHALNLQLLSSVLYDPSELKYINCGYNSIVRFNSSGDIANVIQARNYIRIAKTHEYNKFALWTKNIPAVVNAIELEGKPDNLTLIQSSPIVGRPAIKAKYFDYVFTVYATNAALIEDVYYGDNECNGKKCLDCGYKCYLRAHSGSCNICEYLRAGKATRAAFIAAGCR